MVDEQIQLYIKDKSNEFVAECPWFSLRKASRVATQLSNDIMQPSGLRITQLGILAVIAVAGTAQITHLADELVMDQTTLSRNLKPLERDGLVSIAVDETDRRVRIVSLTDVGEITLAQALPLWEQAKAKIDALFGKEQVNNLLAMVASLSDLSAAELG